MKKFLLLFGILLFTFNCAHAAYTQEDFKKDRDACYAKITSNCFYRVYNKYSYQKEFANIAKFDYGYALMVEKEYSKARTIFQSILSYEKTNTKLIELTKKSIQEIDAHQKVLRQADREDTGNYYDKNKRFGKWENPKNLKVYIPSRTGKEFVFRSAFRIWSQKSNSFVTFVFTSNPKDADITCSLVDYISDKHAGLTETKYIRNSKGTFITHADVKVSLSKADGAKYTDKNLESIALHEVGHALGIFEHSDNINDIMYYSTETYKNGYLSRRDVNTIRALYTK